MRTSFRSARLSALYRAKSTSLRLCLVTIIVVVCGLKTGAQVAPDLGRVSDATIWRLQNRNASTIEKGDRKGVRLDAKPDNGVAWLIGSNFSSGTIELDLRGSNSPGQSFVGIAFHGADRATYDAVYFRPFNFQNPDAIRRSHSIQYISQPELPWERLRAEFPDKFEKPISPPPEPDAWLHVRIVVNNKLITVFVNSSSTPALIVNALNGRSGGLIGLWVGNNSSGEFANLSITPGK